jgi:hypothetical protein
MMSTEALGQGSQLRTVTIIGLAALPVAIARYVMKGWVEPHGIPPAVGSLLSSLTVLLLAGMVLMFSQEARTPAGRYVVAAGWFTLLAAWIEAVIIVCILLAGRFGADTYYQGPWESVRHAFPTPERHAMAHVAGFFPKLLLGLALGAVVYGIERRRRAVA